MTKRKKTKFSEETVAKWLRITAEERGFIVLKNHPMTNRGIPDYILHGLGRTFYVETKTTGKECSELQKEFHKDLKRKGIETYVLDKRIDNFDAFYYSTYKTYDPYFNPENRPVWTEQET